MDAQAGASMRQAILQLMGSQQARIEWPEDGGSRGGWPIPTDGPGGGEGGTDETLALLLPLILLMVTFLFLLVLLAMFLLMIRRKRGIILRDETGPTDVGAEHASLLTADGGLEGVERRWLEEQDEDTRRSYHRAKVYQQQYPPNSLPTDITLSQFLSIQEKGVSAWAFEPDYESNPAVIVQSRTELGFLADAGIDGACCVQSNLPLPKLNEVYYWEAKMYELPPGTTVSIGLATKPFPSFRMPGWNKHSIGYFSSDGFKSTAYPFLSTSYGPALAEGDVLGVGYRPRSGTVFFTRNGKRLPDAFTGLGYGLSAGNVFPTVAADGAAAVHVNLGQAGFVFIEANVKKWGLAPMLGTLAPPPAYGAERGSILLEAAQGTSSGAAAEEERRRLSAEARAGPSRSRTHRSRRPPPAPISPSASFTADPAGAASALANSNLPTRPSPLRHSRHPSSTVSPSLSGSASPGPAGRESESDDEPQNPPTPGLLDISLHSLHRFPAHPSDEESEGEVASHSSGSGSVESELSEDELPRRRVRPRRAYDRPPAGAPQQSATGLNVEPPAYHPYDPAQYAPGVAEAIIEDAFSNLPTAARHHPHHSNYAFPGAGGQGRPAVPRTSSRGASVPVGATGGPGGQGAGGAFARAFRSYFFGEDEEDRVSAAEAGRA